MHFVGWFCADVGWRIKVLKEHVNDTGNFLPLLCLFSYSLLQLGSEWGGPSVSKVERWGRDWMRHGRALTYLQANPSPPRCRHISRAGFSRETVLWSPGERVHAARTRTGGMACAYFWKKKNILHRWWHLFQHYLIHLNPWNPCPHCGWFKKSQRW